MRRLVFGGVGLWMILSGCSAAVHGGGPRPPAEPTSPTGSVVLYVKNDHAEDVRVYLIRGSTEIPVGAVRAFNARRFVIPPAQLGMDGTLQVVARALASKEVASPAPLDVEPGAEVVFWVEDNLKYSRLLPGVFRSH